MTADASTLREAFHLISFDITSYYMKFPDGMIARDDDWSASMTQL
jgi:hypothetical protein